MRKANLLIQRTVKTPTFWVGILSLLFFLSLAYFFPYSHDDWVWGTSDWNAIFETNGRYLGSLLAMLLTRSAFLKTIVIGGCCWSVCYLVYKIAGGVSIIGFIYL